MSGAIYGMCKERMQSSLSSAAIERDEVSVCLPPLHTTRNGARNRRLMMALFILLLCVPARAQTSTTEFFPEIDANYHLNSKVRFVFQAKETREGGSPTQAEHGGFTWRYRNRLTVERRFTIRSDHPAPYVSAEPFYKSQYAKWSKYPTQCGLPVTVEQALRARSVLGISNTRTTWESVRIGR